MQSIATITKSQTKKKDLNNKRFTAHWWYVEKLATHCIRKADEKSTAASPMNTTSSFYGKIDMHSRLQEMGRAVELFPMDWNSLIWGDQKGLGVMKLTRGRSHWPLTKASYISNKQLLREKGLFRAIASCTWGRKVQHCNFPPCRILSYAVHRSFQ